MYKTVSIIIPCYNVELYVGKCIESVLAQDYSRLEIILIDDGSTDGTAAVLKRYLGDGRVKLIRQANAGVSAARNVGIDAATGELLGFVDSDDWIEPDMYAVLCDSLSRGGADMAVCNYNLVYDDHTDMLYSLMRDGVDKVHPDTYGFFTRHCACPKPNNYIWTRLYKADIVKNSGVRFEDYKLGDDTLFNFKLLPHIGSVSFADAGLYNYYQRGNSNVYTVAKKGNLASVYADTFDALAEYYTANGFTEFLQALPIHAFTRLRSVFFYSRLAGLSEDEITRSVMTGFKDREIAKYLTGAI
jgi:glycosyltransferase involved in cell wall biosynthesis